MEKIERTYVRDQGLSGSFKEMQLEQYSRDWLEPMRRKSGEGSWDDDYVSPRAKSKLDGYFG
ncbi:hypothetical protein [Piscirickettsia litoralis]|uniref:Uncharacterized protein n=1 Tax=Piscirickettsia litoralis TaxID=1891921 RepID=A0ABX2ZZA0_9GAMM|nr:hypothetical protein [Piscirickettsia litoralis]ODN41897.1 hypothetical protein BGC07_01615 [Piscirickettsia litoralis]